MPNFTHPELEVLEFVNSIVRYKHLSDDEDRILSYAFSYMWNGDFEFDTLLASDIISTYLNLEPVVIDLYRKKIERNERIGDSANHAFHLMENFKRQRDRIHYLYVNFAAIQMTHKEVAKDFIKSNPTFMDTLDNLYTLSNNEIDVFKHNCDNLISTLDNLTVEFYKLSETITPSTDRKEI